MGRGAGHAHCPNCDAVVKAMYEHVVSEVAGTPEWGCDSESSEKGLDVDEQAVIRPGEAPVPGGHRLMADAGYSQCGARRGSRQCLLSDDHEHEGKSHAFPGNRPSDGLDAAQLDALEEIAEQATPGPWERLAGDEGRRVASQSVAAFVGNDLRGKGRAALVARVERHDPFHHYDAALIASCSPDVVLWLIGRARRLAEIEAVVRGQA